MSWCIYDASDCYLRKQARRLSCSNDYHKFRATTSEDSMEASATRSIPAGTAKPSLAGTSILGYSDFLVWRFVFSFGLFKCLSQELESAYLVQEIPCIRRTMSCIFLKSRLSGLRTRSLPIAVPKFTVFDSANLHWRLESINCCSKSFNLSMYSNTRLPEKQQISIIEVTGELRRRKVRCLEA